MTGVSSIGDALVRVRARTALRATRGPPETLLGDVALLDSMLFDGLNDAFSGQHSGWHTEDLVQKMGITRADQDRWALRSQQRFSEAQAAGRFKDEIVDVEVPSRKGPVAFSKDEHNRPETTDRTATRCFDMRRTVTHVATHQ